MSIIYELSGLLLVRNNSCFSMVDSRKSLGPGVSSRGHAGIPERNLNEKFERKLPARTADFSQPPGSPGPHSGKLAETRLRDMRSAVKRWLSCSRTNRAIVLDLLVSSSSKCQPLALGLKAKRFANIRSDFLAAVKLRFSTGAIVSLSPEWAKLFERVSGRRSQLGLSRLARYASLVA
jgi:hypothetical protein